eukprot:5903290-Amphidinium_carterae.1
MVKWAHYNKGWMLKTDDHELPNVASIHRNGKGSNSSSPSASSIMDTMGAVEGDVPVGAGGEGQTICLRFLASWEDSCPYLDWRLDDRDYLKPYQCESCRRSSKVSACHLDGAYKSLVHDSRDAPHAGRRPYPWRTYMQRVLRSHKRRSNVKSQCSQEYHHLHLGPNIPTIRLPILGEQEEPDESSEDQEDGEVESEEEDEEENVKPQKKLLPSTSSKFGVPQASSEAKPESEVRVRPRRRRGGGGGGGGGGG